MSKLRVATDSLYWLFSWSDAISTLFLLSLGFKEMNPLHAILGNVGFWVAYAAASLLLWGMIKAFQHHFMHHKCSVVSYVALLTYAFGHAICTLNNVGQVI